MNFLILAAQIVLAASSLGLVVMIARKIPALVALDVSDRSKEGHILRLKKKIQEVNPLKGTKPEIFLQKLLSKIRVWSLKADNKATELIQILHKRVERKNNFFQIFPERKDQAKENSPSGSQNPAENKKNDNYWKEIKTSVSATPKRKSPSKRSKKK
jgi:hypothetical protein